MKSAYFILLSLLVVRLSSGFMHFPPSPNHGFPPSTQSVPTRSLSIAMASLTGIDDGVSPRLLVSQGMEAFKKGDIKGSIDLFDKADAKVPDGSLTPFLWQRGLSLYYANRFEDASKQVRALFDVHYLSKRFLCSIL